MGRRLDRLWAWLRHRQRNEFGFESLRDSLSDILFNSVGVARGYRLLRPVREPPFCLWC